MGLDLYVETPEHCADWSYSGFNRFRTRLAEVAGLGELAQYQGFGGNREWPARALHPLVPLLSHSDCDGELDSEDCSIVGPALRAAVQAWEADDYDRIEAEHLADAMDSAAENETRILFR